MFRFSPVPLTLLALGVVLAAPPPRPAHAQVEKVTAAEVVDKETLRKFILWAESVMSQIEDINEGAQLLEEVRTEGSDYNSGNMYVILFSTQGHVFIHGEDPNIDGKLVVNVQDDQGTTVVQNMLAAGAEDGGGFVEWCWDDPADPDDTFCKDAYAIQYFSPVANVDFVLVGGYYQDLTHAGEPLPEIPLPEIGAADVVDRETLRQFVHGSLDWLVELLELVGFARANEWKAVLREEGGHFKSGPIYLFVFTPEAYVLFHGANAWREGRYTENLTDINGTRFVEQMIAAAQAGGGFVEYFWDDPSVEGDEDTGSPKVSYALSFTSDYDFYPGQEFILGAGFYRNFSTAEAEQAAEDWLHRFSRSVASQAMEMIGNRVSHSYDPDNRFEVGGQSLDFGALRDLNNPYGSQGLSYLGSLLSSAGAAARTGNGAHTSPSPFMPHSANSLLNGSSFQVSPGASGGGGYSLWGGGEIMRFSNEQGDGFGEGEVSTAMLGADYALGSVVAGLAVTHSRGSGRFELGRPGDDDFGDVTTTLTSGFPYARLSIGDRLFTWGVLGYGSGNLNIEGGGEKDPESPISMRMGGLGLKAELVPSEGVGDFELAVRSDAFVARMTSEEVEGRRELNTNANRVRVMLESSTGVDMGSSTMRPQLRVAMRYDGGDNDVDTGMGMEVGGGLTFINLDRGLTIRMHGRRLMVHEQDEYDEWGLGGSLRLNPGGGGRGLSIGVRPTWGSTATSAAQLWALGATAMAPGGGGFGPGRRGLDAEVGYGLDALTGQGLFTPYARLVISESLDAAWFGAGGLATRAGPTPVAVSNHGVYGYQLGGRLSLGPGLAAGIEAGRSIGSYNGDGPYRATVNLSMRF